MLLSSWYTELTYIGLLIGYFPKQSRRSINLYHLLSFSYFVVLLFGFGVGGIFDAVTASL